MLPAVEAIINESSEQQERGLLAEAEALAQQALAEAYHTGDAPTICGALCAVAMAHLTYGRYEETEQIARQALTFAEDTMYSAWAWRLLGIVHAVQDNLRDAEQCNLVAADLSRRLHDHRRTAMALQNLAMVYLMRGKFLVALETVKVSNVLFEVPAKQWMQPSLRAWLYLDLGDREAAREAIEALQAVAVPGSRYDCERLMYSAQLALAEGRLDDAYRDTQQAKQIAETQGHERPRIQVRHLMALWHFEKADYPAAVEWIEAALDLAEYYNNNFDKIQMYVNSGLIHWRNGDPTRALHNLHQGLALAEAMGAEFHQVSALLILAALQQAQGDPEAAHTWHTAAIRIRAEGYTALLDNHRTLAYPLIGIYLRSPDAKIRAATEALLVPLAQLQPLPLFIQGLGQFRVAQGHTVLPSRVWQRRRAGELFRYLLLQPHHSAHREVLLEALWPDQTPTSAQNSLHQATSALRRLLEPDLPSNFPSRYLNVEAERVTLRLPSGSTVDFLAWEQEVQAALESEARVAMAHCLESYRGDLFPDDPYADWALAARERLHQLQLHARTVLAAWEVAVGNHLLAISHARRVLQADPWQEEAASIAMQAYLRLGQRPAALQLYQELAAALHNDLDMEPRADLQALAAAIGRGERPYNSP